MTYRAQQALRFRSLVRLRAISLGAGKTTRQILGNIATRAVGTSGGQTWNDAGTTACVRIPRTFHCPDPGRPPYAWPPGEFTATAAAAATSVPAPRSDNPASCAPSTRSHRIAADCD